MVDFDHERDFVSVFAANHAEDAKGRADHVASAFDGKLNDSSGVKANRVFGKRGSGRVFDPLIDGEDADVTGAAQSPVVEHFLKRSKDFVVAIGLRVNAIHEIWPGEVKKGLIDGFALVTKKILGLVAQDRLDFGERSRHDGFYFATFGASL